MAMGKRRKRTRQSTMWVATTDLPRSAGHPFYERLNRVLDDADFDDPSLRDGHPLRRHVLYRTTGGRAGQQLASVEGLPAGS